MSDQEKMFRYLLKYVGKYKVLTELTIDGDYVRDDQGNIAPDYDELYIPCSYDGKIKHTYTDSILAYFTDKKSTYKKVMEKFEKSEIAYNTDDLGDEFIIYFNDEDMSKVAKIVGAQVKGKKISPFNKVIEVKKRLTPKKEKTTNLIKEVSYELPPYDKQLYYKALSVIKDKGEKKVVRELATNAIVQSLADKTFYSKRDALKMTSQEYIHYIGKWRDYIDYIKEYIKLR